MAVPIDLTDRHEQHPDSVRDYALEKVGKLERYFDRLQRIEVVLDKEHERHSVEVIVTASRGKNFVARDTNESVMAAIDQVHDKLERQVVKAKERLKDHHRGQPTR